MAVAKSYEKATIIGDVFTEDGKNYVKIRNICSRCGGSGHYSYNQMDGTRCYGCSGTGKQTLIVRWYSDAERARMDKAAEKRAIQREEARKAYMISHTPYKKFGFNEQNFIYIFFGENNIVKKFFHEDHLKIAKYNPIFGWYLAPQWKPDDLILPDNLMPYKLTWDMVHSDDENEPEELKSDKDIIDIINNIRLQLFPSTSEFIGNIKDRIEVIVTIKRAIEVYGTYGSSIMHLMEDENKNVFIWTTAAKALTVDEVYHLRGTVKDHKEYKGVKQTILTRCSIMK